MLCTFNLCIPYTARISDYASIADVIADILVVDQYLTTRRVLLSK